MSGSALPAELREAVAEFIHDIPPAALAARASALSKSYREGRASESLIGNRLDVGAYLAARLPATYAAMTAALRAVADAAPAFTPRSLLDAGAGPGTASWAATEQWASLDSLTMIDRNLRFLSTAADMARASSNAAVKAAQTIGCSIRHMDGSLRFDAVLAGYTMSELPGDLFAVTLAKLWNNCSGILLIVEPGTPRGFQCVLAARRFLLDLSARIVAPCPGAYACPMAAPKWCHFAVRLPRSRAHLRAKDAEVPFEDEKFSYLAVAREGVALEPIAGRIVAPPRRLKPEIRLTVCADGTISERAIPTRDKAAFKIATKKSWGDVI